jgi:hypothetical protein
MPCFYGITDCMEWAMNETFVLKIHPIYLSAEISEKNTYFNGPYIPGGKKLQTSDVLSRHQSHNKTSHIIRKNVET